MGEFTGPLETEQKITVIDKKFLWCVPYKSTKVTKIVLLPFDYIASNGDTVHIEEGYETDFATIPQVFWSLGLSPDGPYAQAAVVHDKIYGNHQFLRERCDQILREAALDLHTPVWKADAIYAGVRIGGRFWY